jgi:hypothetical protein
MKMRKFTTARPRNTYRPSTSPSVAPRGVAMAADVSATTSEFRTASFREGSAKTFRYQSSVNPQNRGICRSPGMSLNPYRIMRRIGETRYSMSSVV